MRDSRRQTADKGTVKRQQTRQQMIGNRGDIAMGKPAPVTGKTPAAKTETAT